MKRISYVYMLGFLVGIIFANLIAKEYIISIGMLGNEFLRCYSAEKLKNEIYIWHIIKQRIPGLLFLAVSGCLKSGKLIGVSYIIWLGFSTGLIITAAVLKLGVKGILLYIASILPHYILYAISILVLLNITFNYPKIKLNISKIIILSVFVSLGIMLECWINPIFVEMVLKII